MWEWGVVFIMVMELRGYFKKYGKRHILNYLKDFHGYVFKIETVDLILYYLNDNCGEIEKHLSSYVLCPDFWSYNE